MVLLPGYLESHSALTGRGVLALGNIGICVSDQHSIRCSLLGTFEIGGLVLDDSLLTD